MSDAEVEAMLAGSRKVQLATINPDGYPHLVTMYYTLIDGKIAFWTYRTSQKALNLARDPRISCLVETGEAYFDLRGVQVQGTVETITDYVANAARKRYAYIVEPVRVISWDHAKLMS